MIIRVDEIKPSGVVLESEELPDSFPVLNDLRQDGVIFDSPFRVRLHVIRVAELIEIDGYVETVARLSCSRCLSEFDYPLSARFDMTFSRELPSVDDEEGKEVELSAEEMGITLFEGDEINSDEALQEQVVMALPLHPLCSEGCKGICPQCGADRNLDDCSCAPEVFNPKFAALKGFKAEKKND